jgi:hypothetical protein
MIDEGKKDELDESYKVLLREPCWEDNTMFLLLILAIRLISGGKPLLLIEARESKHMKERPKLKKQKVIVDFYGLPMSRFQFFLDTNISFNCCPRTVKLSTCPNSV